MKALREIFSDDTQHLSFMRVMSGSVTLTILFVWAIHCLRTVTWTPLDAGSVTALLGLGALKVWQKGKEGVP